MKHTLITLLALCLCLAGCGKKEQAKTPPIDPSKHERFLWAFETGDGVYSSPAIGSDGTVYVGSNDNKLYAINGKTGKKLWEFETGRGVVSVALGVSLPKSHPALGADGTVYVGSPDSPSKLYAIKTDSKGLAKSPWPMRGQNPQRTGWAPTSKK